MINTKRGLSDIITNVLIILLVLVAVGIIWAFVRPAIQGGAQQVAGASDCLAVNVVPTACADGAGATWDVTLRRGAGSSNIDSYKVIFRSDTGQAEVLTLPGTDADAPGEFEEILHNYPVTLIPSEVDVSVVVSASGQLKTCEPSGTPVTCTP